MQRPSTEFVVYIVGVGLLGVFFEPARVAVGSSLWVAAAVAAYLVALRGIGWAIRRMGRE